MSWYCWHDRTTEICFSSRPFLLIYLYGKPQVVSFVRRSEQVINYLVHQWEFNSIVFPMYRHKGETQTHKVTETWRAALFRLSCVFYGLVYRSKASEKFQQQTCFGKSYLKRIIYRRIIWQELLIISKGPPETLAMVETKVVVYTIYNKIYNLLYKDIFFVWDILSMIGQPVWTEILVICANMYTLLYKIFYIYLHMPRCRYAKVNGAQVVF